MEYQLRQSFQGIREENSIIIPGIDKYMPKGDQLYINPTSGVVTTSLRLNEIEVANYWSDQIFTSNDVEDYSAIRPFAKARLNYVAHTAKDFLRKVGFEPRKICDFATGECVLPPIYTSLFPNSNIVVTEASPDLASNAQRMGFDTLQTYLGCGTLKPLEIEFASICWTLCNCINPLKVLEEIANTITANGYLIVAESSRIMVPFKKTLSDLISKNHPADIHPYYFSANSLSMLGILAGLKPVYYNRFYDSDVLTIIFKKDEKFQPNLTDLRIDKASDILEFFEKYIEYSKYFESKSLLKPAKLED